MEKHEAEDLIRDTGNTDKMEEAKGQSRPVRSKTVSLRLFIITVLGFLLAILVLGLTLGLFRARPAGNVFGNGGPSPSDTTVDILKDNGGLYPQELEFVPIGQLIDSSALGRTQSFTVTNQTGVREYEFDITQALAAPDGFTKPMILVNGQSPGPKIEANTGDVVRVKVNNRMANTSTTIHFHGIDQKNSSLMDGVAGVTQCPIRPGQTFTYEFRCVQQRGTFWYHAHTNVHYSDGLYGAIIIHEADERVPLVDDEKIVFMGDLYHTYAGLLLQSYLSPGSVWAPDISGYEPLPDNIVMNGQNTYNCSVKSSTLPEPVPLPTTNKSVPICTGGELSRTTVKPGQRVRLRLINHSSFFSLWFSVDNHTLYIVEMDGVEVEPIEARGVYVNIGQRYSVVMVADQAVGTYHMRATLPRTCFVPYAAYISAGLAESADYAATGLLTYEGADPAAPPLGAPANTTNPYGVDTNGLRGDVWEGCEDMPFNMPVPRRPMAAVDVAETNKWSVRFQFEQAGPVNRVFINKTSWVPLVGDAQIWEALDQLPFIPGNGNSYNSWNFSLSQQLLLIPEPDKGAQIAISSLDDMEHPFHLHGHTFQVVAWGPGEFTDGNTTTWNLLNPMRRDTITVPAHHHIVLRFTADNPGVWALHCHVAWHMEEGMFVSLLERPADLKGLIDGMDPNSRHQAKSLCAKRANT